MSSSEPGNFLFPNGRMQFTSSSWYYVYVCPAHRHSIRGSSRVYLSHSVNPYEFTNNGLGHAIYTGKFPEIMLDVEMECGCVHNVFLPRR